jgi:hypothetical protein
MTELPYVDSFDPEEKDECASPSTSESSTPYLHTDTTLTPPRTQYGAMRGKAEQGKWLRYAGFAIPCTPLQRLIDHS